LCFGGESWEDNLSQFKKHKDFGSISRESPYWILLDFWSNPDLSLSQGLSPFLSPLTDEAEAFPPFS